MTSPVEIVEVGHKLQELSISCYDELIPDHNEFRTLVINLQNLNGKAPIKPSGVVGLLLIIKYYHNLKKKVKLFLPHDDNILNYLERIDFFAKTREFIEYDWDIEWRQQNARNPSDRFTEIISTQNKIDYRQVIDVFDNFIKGRMTREKRLRLRSFLEETIYNVRDHASLIEEEEVFYCAQIQTYMYNVHLALGDIGVGIRHSLNASKKFRFKNDLEPIRNVIDKGISRITDDEERGGGLKRAYEAVRDVGLKMFLRSGSAAILLSRNNPLEFEGLKYVPGTQISILATDF
jgi:hypothetical protein